MTAANPSAIFLDTNILVYAHVASAPHHQIALSTLQTLQQSHCQLWLSRQVLREFIATLTRPQTFAIHASPAQIAAAVTFFSNHFQVADDNARVTAHLLQLLQQIPIGGRQIHDANIVATMLASGVTTLLTNNTSDFNRFAHLIAVRPLVSSTP
ncbi:PIN domain-containing protein [bacterium]|nr:PIN domain-containing protein [bacterium]